MNGILFQKKTKKRARRAHAKQSILQKDIDRRRCWLCMHMRHDYSEHAHGVLHKHHVYMGPLRDISEGQGFYVYLCPQHHMYVHRNAEICRSLQTQMQKAYERTHTREEFMQLIGRSYLDSMRGDTDGECEQ